LGSSEVPIVGNEDVVSLEGMWSEDRLCSLCLRFFEMFGESRDGVDCPLWADFGDPQELVSGGVVFEDLARYCRSYAPARASLTLEDMRASRRFPLEGSC
jgi:hypothetical protein